jgi:hypothetical protein
LISSTTGSVSLRIEPVCDLVYFLALDKFFHALRASLYFAGRQTAVPPVHAACKTFCGSGGRQVWSVYKQRA